MKVILTQSDHPLWVGNAGTCKNNLHVAVTTPYTKGECKMNQIIKILMNRDDLTKEEATDLYNEVKEMIEEDPMIAEEILISELGLEMDYIFDFI